MLAVPGGVDGGGGGDLEDASVAVMVVRRSRVVLEMSDGRFVSLPERRGSIREADLFIRGRSWRGRWIRSKQHKKEDRLASV